MANEIRDRALALTMKARFPNEAPKLLALLEDERRARIEALMAAASADPEAELRKLRSEELDRAARECSRRFGPVWNELSPALRFWAWGKIQI